MLGRLRDVRFTPRKRTWSSTMGITVVPISGSKGDSTCVAWSALGGGKTSNRLFARLTLSPAKKRNAQVTFQQLRCRGKSVEKGSNRRQPIDF
jgi:hypothetical protein